jgi:hypothetical protein
MSTPRSVHAYRTLVEHRILGSGPASEWRVVHICEGCGEDVETAEIFMHARSHEPVLSLLEEEP